MNKQYVMRGRLLAWFAAVSVLSLVLSGCGDTQGDQANPSTLSVAATPTIPISPQPVDFQDSIAKIPLDGQSGSPISWRLDKTHTPSEREMVAAVRYNLALNVAVTTGGHLVTRYSDTRDDRVKHFVGPRRYWLSTPHTFKTNIGPDPDDAREINVCQDLTSTKSADSTPKLHVDDVTASKYYVTKVVDKGVRRWKVYSVASIGVIRPYRSAAERECAACARKAPTEG